MTTTMTRRPSAPASLRVVARPVAPAIEQAVDDYLAAVHARGGSARTDEYYEACLRQVFLPWAAAEKLTALELLDQRRLDRFNAWLLAKKTKATRHTEARPLSRATVATYLRGVRQLLRWAQQDGLAKTGLKVQSIKVPKSIVVTLSREEMTTLESAAGTERDKLIIRLLADTGIRLNELLGLSDSSLVKEGHNRFIQVLGKGRRERKVPVAPALFARLQRYATQGRPVDCTTRRIFISRRRRPSGLYEALDARAVQQMLRAVAQQAGIAQAVHPHLFRHSFITNAMRRGVDVVLLARMVGHADLSMIASTYEHASDSDLAAQMMKALAEPD